MLKIRDSYFRAWSNKGKNKLKQKFNGLVVKKNQGTLFSKSKRREQLESYHPFDSESIADFFDADNDGDNDLYVLNGMNEFNLYSSENPYYADPLTNQSENVYIPVSTKESNVFFVNEGGKLTNKSENSGLDYLGNSRSATYLDFDRDGDLDIAINNYHDSAVIYRNNLSTFDSQWIKVRLVGNVDKRVNRDAIGAKIILTTNEGQTIWREIHGSIGYMSVHPKTQHIGIGQSKIDNIKIIWPNSEVQILTSLTANREHVVVQH